MIIWYCPMKYHKFLSGRLVNILKNIYVKIVFKTYSNLIKTTNNKSEKI